MLSMLKRRLSLLLVLVMVFSMMPMQAFATESEYSQTSTETIDVEQMSVELDVSEPEVDVLVVSDQVQEVQTRIDEILNTYLGTTSATKEEMEILVAEMDEVTIMDLQFEILILEEDLEFMELTEDEQKTLVANNAVLSALCDILMEYPVDMGLYASKTVTVLDGKVSITDSAGNGSVSNGTYTASATGSLFSKKNNTITILNASDSLAQLSFSYSASNANSFKINNATSDASGTYSALLEPGKYIEFYIQSKSGTGDKKVTLTLGNFSLVPAKAESNVTFDFDSTLGSVTVAGSAVENGASQAISLAEGAELVATPKDGIKFLGWVNTADHAIISTAATYTLKPADDMAVKAAFVKNGGTAWFGVGAASQKSQSSGLLGLSKLYYYQVGVGYLFDDLNAATAAATSSSNNTLVLMNDATLPADDYTIPAGVTLLIPFDGSNTMYTTDVISVTSHATPTAYRTLTLADGANLTINGAMSLSAMHTSAQGSKLDGGSPTGAVSFVQMEGDSQITVNNGGTLYAYGFITGSGSVTVNSGGSVYENFQIMDFRGGTQSTDMDNGVFPLCQYYIQNIEVEMTLYSGAKEYAYTTIYMSDSDFGSSVAFISNKDAMFNLANGYVTKRYDGETDRLIVESYGDFTVSSINMSVGSSSINSKNYELPINSNMTVRAKSGNITLNQDIAMLPGSIIEVDNGATCIVGSGNNIYVYDADQWGNYCGPNKKTLIPVTYAPGRTGTRTDADLVDAKIVVNGTVDASKGYVYVTAGGADVSGTGIIKLRPGTQKVTHQLIQGEGYVEIPLIQPQLKNGDETVMQTGITSGTYTYNVESGMWSKNCNHEYIEEVITAATCTTEGQKKQTCKDTVNCGYSGTADIDPLGHTEVADAAVAPTCTETGLTEGKHCTRCGEVTVKQNVVEAKGHTNVVDAAVAPTCTETGLTEGAHCGTCGEVFTAQETVDALGHTDVVDAAVAPTCTETGLTEGTHCSVCGVITLAQEPVDALGHTDVVDAAVAPTCTKTGLTEGTHCSVCSVTTLAQETVDALGHSWDDGKILTEATEDNTGEMLYTCGVCGAEETKEIPKLDHVHNYNSVVGTVPATCEAQGYTTYSCRCGGTEDRDFVDMLGHDMAAATCELPATCKNGCGKTEGEALGHKMSGATCELPATCQNGCGKTVGEALGHDMADATCELPSTCKNGCGLTEGESLGHNMVAEEEFPKTCTMDGHSAGDYCTVCGYATWEVYEATGHTMEEVAAQNATYNSVGWEAHQKCSVCGYKENYVEIPKLPEPYIDNYEDFITNLALLEEMAEVYVLENPGKDPLALVIKYIRCGVERYTTGSWGIMAGYEDAKFAQYVAAMEDSINAQIESEDQMLKVTALRNLKNFTVPGVDNSIPGVTDADNVTMDFGHMFGTMDITYHNNGSINHADVAGWTGDLVDLLSTVDRHNVTADSFEELVATIKNDYLCQSFANESDQFSLADMYGDLDGLYIMNTLADTKYANGVLTEIISEYFNAEPTLKDRASYFLRERLNGEHLREGIRTAVYNAYTGNKVIATLEATREFNSTNLAELRKASCYAFADFMCQLAGDYVDVTENEYYTVFASENAILAPGITQQIKYATSADGKQMVYYIATADITRDDVNVYANYNNNDPASGWAMQRVLDQANAAQAKYGDPESEYYIPNYNVIASTNGAGYNMATGEPGGLLVMGGVEYMGPNANGFFGILKDGTAVIGTTEEYKTIYKDLVQEGIAAFGSTLVKNGEVCINRTEDYYTDRASRTAVGITKTGKVVLMVLDGRQEPFSCGGSMQEIAQIMREAGCVEAVNLDGGGSTTFVAKQPGDEALSVINRPSDGYARSVATSLMMVSTAPSSTAFKEAAIEAEADYLTVGASVQMTAKGVSETGDVAQIPEGAYWAVSDVKWGSITEDGIFTALRNGSVDVQLKLGEEIIGSKTMEIVAPDNVYFTKTNINAVYGQSVKLPVKALYQGNDVAMLPSDLVFECNADAGSVDGIMFTAKENSGYKSVKVTVALKNNPDAKATITVALYNQGEVSFDFDQATGGDRQMAWDRVVSNATTDDTITYEVIDADEDMVTNYTFALDMTQIPIPAKLNDLIYMLPGADAADASAWGFLLQLAERISDLSEVKPVIKFDKNLDVDYSQLKIVNEYFELTNTEFDENTNTLTLTLNWIDQTAAIDPETANPLCIVSGIKLTPKDDANWDANKSSLNIVNSGEISYQIYMRASGLYSFAQKPENQAEYDILPYEHPKNASEKGGYFGDVYKTFEDSYTLINLVKNGWIVENGGFAYYVDGSRMTGVQKIDGIYYDFGENGVNVGQTAYTGLFFDEEVNAYRYSKLGALVNGWTQVNGDWYYFKNYIASNGHVKVSGVYFDFEETGRLVSGVWANTLYGTRYYYGPTYYYGGWQNIDGNMYYFREGYYLTGIQNVGSQEISGNRKWYEFDENGVCLGEVNGIHYVDGTYYYIENGLGAEKYLICVDGDYYYSVYGGKLITNKTVTTAGTNCDLPKGTYTFGPDGKMIGSSAEGEIVELDGVLYYYENGKGVEKGLICYNGDYYYTAYKGKVAVNVVVKTVQTNCDLPNDRYEFGADGKMLRGVVEKDGILYYYENGKGVEKGLICYEGDYYYTVYQGKVAIDKVVNTYQTNCDLPNGRYEFGADGKMIQGIIEKDGMLYYYENGKGVEKGLIYYQGNYYYTVYQGRVIVDKVVNTYQTHCDLPNGRYEFGADGKMLQGIVEKDGILYYYENGQGVEKGLINYQGDYYYTVYQGKIATNKVVNTYQTNCDLPKGTYEFGEDGKMLQGIVEKDGVLYYYENGKGVEKGLIYYEGDYYYTAYKGKLAVAQTINVSLTSCGLPKGQYEFDANGKMLQGIVEKDGILYYYENGKGVEKGLIYYEGDYYYTAYKGKLAVAQTINASLSSCDLPKGQYEFGADGKMLQGIIEKDGILYYYENGKGVEKGLFYLDGHYYFSVYKGKLVTNQEFHVWNGNGLLIETTYTFNELGQIVG